MQKIPITAAGFTRLEKELSHLKKVERPDIIQAISEARAHGDLSENAEYHTARERQGFIEGRIAELEGKIGRFDVINISKLKGPKIKFGATVTLADVGNDKEIKYRIVGADESDIANGLVSISAPIARALIGKEEGDVVDVQTPKGMRSYEVLSVEFK
ncbi:MAG: transcription elongation factor GreA [Pseudomonadota bacterium]